jgi:hypothetical protein
MFGFFNHGIGPLANFEASYRAYPVSFIDKLDAEKGDKVFLPPSALDRLCAFFPLAKKLIYYCSMETRSDARDPPCARHLSLWMT